MAEHNKIRVIITNKQKAVKIPTGIRMLVRRCCNAVLRLEKFEGSAEISVTFTDNEGIKALNKQYRDKDIETDVLSFPMGENGVYDTNPETGAQILGDVVISMEKARDQAELFGHSLQREVGYLNGKIVSVTKQITKLFNTGVDHFKCNYKRTQNGEQRPFCGRKIVKATENENIKCRNKVKSHMTFAFYGKAETSECTFKTFDLLFHTP